MKFGKRILQIAAANRELQGYYLDYKSLKKVLKQVKELARDGNPQDLSAEALQCWAEGEASDVADAEERFMLALEGEFAKVESFFRSKSSELLTVFRCLCKRFAKTRISAPLPTALPCSFRDLGACLTGHSEDEDLIQELIDFVDDVDAVRGFVMTNAQALVKICKKHDKLSPIQIREHFMRVLSRCTFYNSREFGGMIADIRVLLNAVYRQFTGRVPPDDSASFTCQICQHVLCSPLELQCNHRFCNSCVSLSTFFSQHRCPVCFQVCELTEEHMRVHTLRSHYERLIKTAPCPAASSPADCAGQEIGAGQHHEDSIEAAHGRRCRSNSDLGNLCSSSRSSGTNPVGGLRKSKSDEQLVGKDTVMCSLEAPCENCVQRSPHVRQLLPGVQGSPMLKQSPSSNKRRLILERIIKENGERHERDRRISSASSTSITSMVAAVGKEATPRDDASEPGGHKSADSHSPVAGPARDGNSPAARNLNVQIPPSEGVATGADEGNPWSPSKRWTACAEVFRSSTDLRRTSSLGAYGVSKAQEMWRRIYDMEAQQKHDRSIRRRLWVIEVVSLLFSVFLCVRVGSPELLCAAHEVGEGTGVQALSPSRWWHASVCGSWGGLITPAALADNWEILSLQEERTRSLHQALDSMVAHSLFK